MPAKRVGKAEKVKTDAMNVSFIFLIALFLFCAVCLFVRFRERKTGKSTPGTLQNPFPLVYLFLPAGAFFILPATLAEKTVVYWFFYFVSAASFFASAAVLNWRMVCDNKGFDYRTAFCRRLRYDYADVRRVRKRGGDLHVCVGMRWFIIDEMTNWQAFMSRYDNWRTFSGLRCWYALQSDRALELAERHRDKPFLQKLDRVRGGKGFLVFYCLTGFVFCAIGMVGLIQVFKKPQSMSLLRILCSVCVLGLGLLSGCGFPYAVSHMDDKQRLSAYMSENLPLSKLRT